MQRKNLLVLVAAITMASEVAVAVPEPTVSGVIGSELNFGNVAAEFDSSGAISLNSTDANKSVTGFVHYFGSSVGTLAEFEVSGLTVGETYLIQLPEKIYLTGNNSQVQVVVNNIASQPSEQFTAQQTTQVVKVTGSAQLSGNQTGDDYTGDVSLVVIAANPD